MKMNPVPNKNKDHIQSFCRNIAPGQKPIYVTLQPLANKPSKECFSIVPQHIAAHGGRQIFGWAIFEIKKVWLEAEFHTIWQCPDGTLIDLTPREGFGTSRIVFLPDPTREYEGIKVAPRFKVLSKNPAISRYVQLSDEMVREANQCNLPDDLDTSLRIQAIANEMEQLRKQLFT